MKTVVVAALLLACRAPAVRDATWQRQARSLSGDWVVRFSYATGGDVVGTMQLTPNATIDRAYPLIGLATDYGTYAVTFRDLGGPPSGGRVPALVAGFVAGDSVVMLFESDRPTFTMAMRGRYEGDSVRGIWSATRTHGTIAGGTFLMARQR
jgi:hypothetical protein